MSDRLSIIDDLSNPRIKSRIIAHIGGLQGVQRIEICKYRPRRTDRQNRFYWPAFVVPLAEYLVAEGNELDDPEDEAHEILKARFLKKQVVDKKLGRMPSVRSTTKLNTVEFNDYLDRCAALLAEVGISVPEPGVYHEPLDERMKGGKRRRTAKADEHLNN